MEVALDRDVERVSSLGDFAITVDTDAETKTISARPTDAVHDVVAAEFGRPVEHIEEALLGDDAMQPGESFEQLGIEVIITVTLCCCLRSRGLSGAVSRQGARFSTDHSVHSVSHSPRATLPLSPAVCPARCRRPP